MSLNDSIAEDTYFDWTGELCFAAFNEVRADAPGIPSPAPKGHHVKAQGNALGMASPTHPSPERA
jgi:hypothetical protein